MLHRIFGCNAFAALADDDGQLGFVVNGGGNTSGRQRDDRAGADNRFGHFGKDDRVARHATSGLDTAVKAAARQLGNVGMVIFPHTKDISARPGQRCGDLNICQGHHWQQSRQCHAGRLHFHNGQRTPCALGNRQVKRLNLPAIG